MKIALVVQCGYCTNIEETGTSDSISSYVRGLAAALATRGHEVHILCHGHATAPGIRDYTYDESYVHAFSFPWSAARLTFSEMIHDWLLANPVDVIEAHQWDHPLLVEQLVGGTPTVTRYTTGFLRSLQRGRPSLDSYYGAMPDYGPTRKVKWSTHLLESRMVANSDVVLCASQPLLDEAKQLMDRGVVLPPGITDVTPCVVPTEPMILISVSQFEDSQKGVEIVPSIVNNIPAGNRIVIVGEAKEGNPVVQKLDASADLDLITDPISEERLRQLYCEASVVIVPTKGESFGYNLLEPMSVGRPVICFDQADPSKRQWPLFSLGQWGSPEALAKIPEVLLQLEAIGPSTVATTVTEFARHFLWDGLVSSYEEIYAQAIAHSLLSGRTRGW